MDHQIHHDSCRDSSTQSRTFSSRIQLFPCIFNIPFSGVTYKKLNTLQEKLSSDIENDTPVQERSQILNLLTWVTCKQDGVSSASVVNQDVFELTMPSVPNICALANKAYLRWLSGDSTSAFNVLTDLEELKSQNNYSELRRQAIGDQAFAYRRLGGPKNLSQSIKLYEEALDTEAASPCVDLFKYQLGVVYRRAAHPNMFADIPGEKPRNYFVSRANRLLLDVAQNCCWSHTLRGCAIAELAYMARYEPWDSPPCPTGGSWQKKAIWYARNSNNSLLLFTVGRAVTDVDLAIELLEKYLQARGSSTAYHRLAVQYERTIRQSKGFRSKDNRIVAHTLDLYKKSVQQDAHNFPARQGYAMLLKSCGDIKSALEENLQIVHSKSAHYGCKNTLIKAYEEAARCFQKIAQEGMAGELYRDCDLKANKMWLGAAILSSETASRSRDIKDNASAIWNYFRYDLHNGQNPSKRLDDRNLRNFVTLIRNEGRLHLKAVETLLNKSDKDLSDDDVIHETLQRFLDDERYDDALVALYLIRTHRSAFETDRWSRDPLQSIAARVQLCAAHDQLMSGSALAIISFRSMFTARYRADSCDVLIVCDEGPGEGSRPADSLARQLQNILIDWFDLDVSRNLQSCQVQDSHVDSMLAEMQRYSVVLVLLDGEDSNRTSDFQSVISQVPDSLKQGGQTQELLVVTARTDQHIPSCLAQLRHNCLADVITNDVVDDVTTPRIDVSDLGESDDTTMSGFAERDRKAHLNMRLFTMLTGSNWPIVPKP